MSTPSDKVKPEQPKPPIVPAPITVSPSPFDYTDTTYAGAAERLWRAYQTLNVYLLHKPPSSPVFNQPGQQFAINTMPLGATSRKTGSATIDIIGVTPAGKPRKTGYSYTNSGVTFGTQPAGVAMNALQAFAEKHFTAPSGKLGPNPRSWWHGPPPTSGIAVEHNLHQLLVSSFDDESLVHIVRLTQSPAKDPQPQAFAKTLWKGLLEKMHVHGYAAPQHFDMLLTLVNLYGLVATDPKDLAKVFGAPLPSEADATDYWCGSERLTQYTRKVGQMCCGMIGSFARYATQAPRPGRHIFDGTSAKQKPEPINSTAADAGPIAVILTHKNQTAAKAAGKATPKRWNVSGMEGSYQFGTTAYTDDGVEHVSPSYGLTRTGIGEIKPGDIAVFLQVSHVLIVGAVKKEKGTDATSANIETLESVGDGFAYSSGIPLEKLTGDVEESDVAEFRDKATASRQTAEAELAAIEATLGTLDGAKLLEAQRKAAEKKQRIAVATAEINRLNALKGRPREFQMKHLGNELRMVSIRRINHWGLDESRKSGFQQGLHCPLSDCTCRGRHDLANP